MSMAEALEHPWFTSITISAPPLPPILPSAPAPRHYSGSPSTGFLTMRPSLVEKSTEKIDTVSTMGNGPDSPSNHDQVLPENYSQEFGNLRLSDQAQTPTREPRPMSVFELELDSQGEPKVPGFSPWSQKESQGSQKAASPAAPSESGASVTSSAKPNSRKRKNFRDTGLDDRDSSPLTEPPVDDDDNDSFDEALPTRQSKATKRAAGDSPAIGSHSKAGPTTRQSGTGRAGVRKGGESSTPSNVRKTSGGSDKSKGKGKAVVNDENNEGGDEADVIGTSTTKVPVRRSARRGGK